MHLVRIKGACLIIKVFSTCLACVKHTVFVDYWLFSSNTTSSTSCQLYCNYYQARRVYGLIGVHDAIRAHKTHYSQGTDRPRNL